MGDVVHVTNAGEWQPLVTRSMSERKPLVVKFSAAWCGPCRRIAPVFERLAGQYDAIFAELDIDRASYVSNYLGITSVPTFQVWVNGIQRSEVKGADPRALERLVSQNCAVKGASWSDAPAAGAGEDSRIFFSGKVEDAVAKARMESKPFVCLLYTEGVDRYAMSDALNEPPLRKRLQEQAVVVALPDSMDAAQAGHFKAAQQFKALYPTPFVPALAIISPQGRVLAYQQGACSKAEVVRTVTGALDALTSRTASNAQSGPAADAAPGWSGLGSQHTTAQESAPGPSKPAEPKRGRVVCDGDVCRVVSDEEEEAVDVDRAAASGQGMDSIVPDAIVSVRLANRGTITGEFDADATLADVLAWIQVSRTDGPGSFSLETSYPRAVLQLQDKDRTLSDLSLCGRSRLLLTPSPDGPFGLGSASLSAGVQRLLPSVFASRGPASRPEAGRASGSFSLSRILSWFDPFEWYYWLTGDHDDGDDVSQDAGRRDPTPGPHLPVSSKAGAGSAGERRGVHTLGSTPTDNGQPNEYFGGDSTTFLGDEGAKKDQ